MVTNLIIFGLRKSTQPSKNHVAVLQFTAKGSLESCEGKLPATSHRIDQQNQGLRAAANLHLQKDHFGLFIQNLYFLRLSINFKNTHFL